MTAKIINLAEERIRRAQRITIAPWQSRIVLENFIAYPMSPPMMPRKGMLFTNETDKPVIVSWDAASDPTKW